jgi:hypothetical protein
MSLPACQERALSSIEGALKASEPHLASMFAIFTRLNQGEPVGAEPLVRERLRWLRPRRALSAIVLLPVMFAAVIVGALLSGSARGATTCDVGYPVGEASSLAHRPSCPDAVPTATIRPAAATSPSAKAAQVKTAPVKTAPAGVRDGAHASAGTPLLCPTAVQVSRFVAMNGVEQALSPPVPTAATTSGRPGMC